MSALTRQQLCAAINISESTVRRLEADGLPYMAVGARTHRYEWRLPSELPQTF